MESRELSVDQIFRILPDVPELAPLRAAILGASVRDSEKTWASSSAYATLDKRVLPVDRLGALVDDAATAARRNVDRLYEAAGRLVEAAAAQDDAAAALHLIALGEAAELEEHWAEARTYYEFAARLGEPLQDRQLLMLALRRRARAHWNLGEVEDAYALYRRSYELAEATDDRAGQVIAAMGFGNMRSLQGRWGDAHRHYTEALALAEDDDVRLRGQLYINLSMVARERGEPEEAQSWLELAEPIWEQLETEDRSVWWNNQGLLDLARGQPEAAEVAFEKALDFAPSHFHRAMVLDNVAELAIRRGLLSQAENAARRAEDYGVAVGSPRVLAEVYTRLGKVCRLRGDPNGVTFFEKALELCRQRQYPLVAGHAHLEYGLFRRALGEPEEARAYLDQAARIFEGLDAVTELARVRRELDDVTTQPHAAEGD